MKNYSWLIFSLLCIISQAQTFNQLRQKISTSPDDTVKVKQLLLLADRLIATNKDSSLYYIDQALSLSQKLDYQSGIMEANGKAGDVLAKMNQRDKAMAHYVEAMNVAHDIQRLDYEQALLVKLGSQSYLKGEYQLAEEYYQKALLINRKNQEERIKIYTNLGMTYTRLTDYSKAFDALTKSNRLSDSLKIHTYLGSNYIDIAVLMGLEKKYGEALYYYDKAAEELKKESDSIMVGYAYLGKGEVYMQMGNYQQAISFFEKIEPLLYESFQQFNLNQNLGISLRSINKLKESEQRFLEAQQINDRQLQHFFYRLSNYIELVRLYKQSGQPDKAIDLAHQAELLAKKNGLLLNYKECLQLLSELYETKGNLHQALLYHKEYSTVVDSIAKIDQSKKLAEAETRFRLGEKNKEVELLGKENEMSKLREQSDRTIMLVLLGSLFILVIAAITIATAYRRTKAKNELLAVQNIKIEQANSLITDQANQLQLADKIKSRFFANISHELRTPVTLITGMLEFMDDGSGTPKKKEQVKIALGNSRKLTTIVEEMLDLTRLESDKVVLRKKNSFTAATAQSNHNGFNVLLEKKNIRLVHDNAYRQAIYLEVDESKFEKIINNLIYNAIKFTPEGGWIRVNSKLTELNTVEIQISDSGIGIHQEDLPHIFDRFYQSEAGLQKHDEQGTGIGLSLVKEFTLLHDGNVSVSSKVGEGAVFSLYFPIVNLRDTEQTETDIGEVEFKTVEYKRPPVILLVEDHEEMRAYLGEVLGDRFKIATAANGTEALNWLTTSEVDLIISDVSMPLMDGYTLLSHLKANEKCNLIPVIMLTARATDEDRLQGLRLGVDDYLTKPFVADELRMRVQNVLLNQATRREWLLKQQDEHEADESGEGDLFMNKVKWYVESRIKDPLIAVGDLASHLALSERQLYRKAGELTGLAPAQLIKEIRLQKAYQLLHSETKFSKLATLASEVGYESAAYFARQFAERFGKKPSEFL